MQTENVPIPQTPGQESFRTTAWVFFLLLFFLAERLIYEFPPTIASIKQHLHTGGFDGVRQLFFIGSAQVLALWLVGAALLTITGCARALVHLKRALFCLLCFCLMSTLCMVISDPTNSSSLLIFLAHAAIVGASLCFIKKWNISGSLIAALSLIALLKLANSPTNVFLFLSYISAGIPLLAFSILYYFTHSAHIRRFFPNAGRHPERA